MTTKPISIADVRETEEELAKFPEFPPRDDMQNTKYIYSQSIITALMNRLGESDTVYVGSEIPLGWDARVRKGDACAGSDGGAELRRRPHGRAGRV